MLKIKRDLVYTPTFKNAVHSNLPAALRQQVISCLASIASDERCFLDRNDIRLSTAVVLDKTIQCVIIKNRNGLISWSGFIFVDNPYPSLVMLYTTTRGTLSVNDVSQIGQSFMEVPAIFP